MNGIALSRVCSTNINSESASGVSPDALIFQISATYYNKSIYSGALFFLSVTFVQYCIFDIIETINANVTNNIKHSNIKRTLSAEAYTVGENPIIMTVAGAKIIAARAMW